MTGSDTNPFDRLDVLVGTLRDGKLSKDESLELQQILDAVPGARRRFAEHMFLVTAMEDECAELMMEPMVAPVTPHARREERRGTWIAVGSAIAITAVLVVTLSDWLRPAVDPDNSSPSVAGEGSGEKHFADESVAVLTQAVDASWGKETTPIKVGGSIPKGTWRLETGMVQLEFYCGATVVLEGPSDIEIVSATESILHAGKLRAQVPPHARGFTVHSPEVELVDLGTAFGIKVDQDRGTEIHVLEGKVELFDAGTQRASSGKRELKTGEGLRIDKSRSTTAIASSPGQFAGPEAILAKASLIERDRYSKWKGYSRKLREDPRVIAYFPFEHDPLKERSLRNASSIEGKSIDGAIVGCVWERGRWPDKQALEFKRPGDRVLMRIPGEHTSLTLMAWLRLDNFDHNYCSLLMSDDFWVQAGGITWRMGQSGKIDLAVSKGQEENKYAAYRTESVFDPYDLGRWMHVAVVYDGASSTVTHYLNGQVVHNDSIKAKNKMRVRINDGQLGNWNPDKSEGTRNVPNFNGRIDELAVFSVPLDADEIAEHYEVGRPEL